MKITAKIKDIDQREIWSQSSIGSAGIITNGIATIDIIDFKNELMWYESFVMMVVPDDSVEGYKSVKSHLGRACYKFDQVEWININGVEIKL